MLLWLAAGCAAILTPVLLLGADPALPRPGRAVARAPIRLAEAPPLDATLARPLFTEPAAESVVVADDPGGFGPSLEAPELVGVVGRLPDDAVALVRSANGRTRTLHIGDSVEGWRLSALAVDAAFFTRGDERIRVGLMPAP